MITYRPAVEADAEWMTPITNDPQVIVYDEPDRLTDPYTVEQFLAAKFPALADSRGIWWAILDDGRPVGWVCVRPKRDAWELSYRLGRAAWGRGIATAAVRAALTWADAQDIETVFAEIAAPNAASIRVVEKLGFRHVSTGEWHGMEDRRYERPCA
jgi:RimJ/RimL family protein N-acetyltransferase